MRLADYPYGRVTERLKKAVAWLRKNKNKIRKTQWDYFDFPDYWGMPKSISYRLSSDEVDWLQESTWDWFDENNFPEESQDVTI
jgi:hypothetical protein